MPWFIVAFAAAVALRSTGVLVPTVVDAAGLATTVCLAAGMFGLGLGVRGRDLWPLPLRAFALAVVSTALAAGVSLGLVVVLG